MPTQTVAVLGALLQDHTIIMDREAKDGETVIARSYSAQMGGKGANSAVAVYRLSRNNPARNVNADNTSNTNEDLRLHLVSAVGNDDLGLSLKNELQSCGVNVDGVKVLENEETSVGTILVEAETGANRIMLFPGAAHALSPDDFKTRKSLGGGVAPDFIIAHLELSREAIEQAIEIASLEKIEILLNPTPARYLVRDIYPKITHLVMNEMEALTLSDSTLDNVQSDMRWEKTAEYFHSLDVPNVVITLGENGAYYSHKDGDHAKIDAEKNCDIVDTSGAGDTFVGAYVASCMAQKRKEQWDIGEAVRFGCMASSHVIEKPGRLQPIPWFDEIHYNSDDGKKTPEA